MLSWMSELTMVGQARRKFPIAAAQSFELPVVERTSLHRDVVARVAVLRFGEDLDSVLRGEFVGDGGEVGDGHKRSKKDFSAAKFRTRPG
jgi:hypothetical protein